MKVLLELFKKKTGYQFAIKKSILTSGKETLIPVMKNPGLFQEWLPIVQIYDKYYAAPGFEIEREFTEVECMEHIEGYLSQLKASKADKVRTVEFVNQLDVYEHEI